MVEDCSECFHQVDAHSFYSDTVIQITKIDSSFVIQTFKPKATCKPYSLLFPGYTRAYVLLVTPTKMMEVEHFVKTPAMFRYEPILPIGISNDGKIKETHVQWQDINYRDTWDQKWS